MGTRAQELCCSFQNMKDQKFFSEKVEFVTNRLETVSFFQLPIVLPGRFNNGFRDILVLFQ